MAKWNVALVFELDDAKDRNDANQQADEMVQQIDAEATLLSIETDGRIMSRPDFVPGALDTVLGRV